MESVIPAQRSLPRHVVSRGRNPGKTWPLTCRSAVGNQPIKKREVRVPSKLHSEPSRPPSCSPEERPAIDDCGAKRNFTH